MSTTDDDSHKACPEQSRLMLTVIICTYNRASSLRQTLDSLLGQEGLDGKTPWELLVVDNNSNDHTKEVVEKFRPNAKFDVRYLFEPRQGKTYALNAGIADSRGQILAFTDDDVIADKRWVASVMEATNKYPHKAFGGRVLPVWPPGPIPPWLQPKGPNSPPVVGSMIVSHGVNDEETAEYGKGKAWVPIGANMFFRREVFDTYGGFRTDLGPRGEEYSTDEDSEFGFRLKNKGERILYYPMALIYHPVPQHKLSADYFLKFAWAKGLALGKMDSRLRILSRCKICLKSSARLLIQFVRYLFSLINYDPARTMRLKHSLYSLSGRIYYLTTRLLGAK